jgi:TDG/mug DNA glycosylase family protein
MPDRSRPSAAALERAAGRTIPDVLAPGLDVVFCGINPGRYSAAVGHHFARPGNRFWKALHLGGFTASVLDPDRDGHLVEIGIGLTNLVARATTGAGELTPDELRRGADRLRSLAEELAPRCVAVLGIGAYRTAFGDRHAAFGPQPEGVGPAALWVLPNPSGLNAHHQLADLGARFGELRSSLAR